MGIEYYGKQGDLVTKTREGSCWGGFGMFIKDQPLVFRNGNTDEVKDYLGEATNLDVTKPWEVVLSLDKNTAYYASYIEKERLLVDEVFDKLFGEWFHPSWITYHYSNGSKARTGISYHDSCPYYLVVASSSLYRMYDDMSSFFNFWETIDLLLLDLDHTLYPWMQYFIVTNLRNITNNRTDMLDGWTNVGCNTGHMAIDSTYGSLTTIQHLESWNWLNIVEGDITHQPMISMREELNITKTLNFMGRDFHLCNEPMNASANFFEKIVEELPHDHRKSIYKPRVGNSYINTATIKLREFIKSVLIPNNL